MALGSDNPERLRHAATSARELLIQVLEELAPDSAFSIEEKRESQHNGQVTHRMRLAKILGVSRGSEKVKFLDTQISAVIELYECLNRPLHDRTGHVPSSEVAGLLFSLNGVLVMLLGVNM